MSVSGEAQCLKTHQVCPVTAPEWAPNCLSKEGCSEDRRDIQLTGLSGVTPETALDVRPPTVDLSDHTGSLRCYHWTTPVSMQSAAAFGND
jgi:hypothetical protein